MVSAKCWPAYSIAPAAMLTLCCLLLSVTAATKVCHNIWVTLHEMIWGHLLAVANPSLEMSLDCSVSLQLYY